MVSYKTYKNISRKSSIVKYYIYKGRELDLVFKGKTWIRRWVNTFTYRVDENGWSVFNQMRDLAEQGKGLNTFINKRKPKYVWPRWTNP